MNRGAWIRLQYQTDDPAERSNWLRSWPHVAIGPSRRFRGVGTDSLGLTFTYKFPITLILLFHWDLCSSPCADVALRPLSPAHPNFWSHKRRSAMHRPRSSAERRRQLLRGLRRLRVYTLGHLAKSVFASTCLCIYAIRLCRLFAIPVTFRTRIF